MIIPLGIAKKLVQLTNGEVLPASQLKHAMIQKMVEDGVIHYKTIGRNRKQYFIVSYETFANYLKNKCGINDLQNYVDIHEKERSRADNIVASSDSKSSKIRTFKGFLVNCLDDICTSINETEYVIRPCEGVFTYVHDYESFEIPTDVTVIGVENGESFRYIKEQSQLFSHIKPLFVSRYPQSNDLVRWLKRIPNQYIHFGDFDFEGIRIFKNEYARNLNDRANFFIPPNIERYIDEYGNITLYDRQLKVHSKFDDDPNIARLIKLFHQYKKCLEQEVFIRVREIC